MQLIFFSKMLNQIQNWILRELVLLWVLMVLVVSLYTMMTQFMRDRLVLGSLLCIKEFW